MQICTRQKVQWNVSLHSIKNQTILIMKKLLTLAFAFIAFISISNAQFGLRGGLNLSSVTLETEGISAEPDSKITFHIGVTYEKMINENLSFRPGLLFSAKGYSFEVDGIDEDFGANFGYLEIPLDFVYNTGSIGIHAGPYIGMLMSAKSGDEDIKETVESLDYGLNLGLTYNVNEQIGVGLNYGLGLANLAKDSGDEDSSIKNKVIGLFVTYKL